MTYHSAEEIRKKIKELGNKQPWNHDIELPFGIRTIGKSQESLGKNLVKWERIKPFLKKISIYDKRVLDVGCSEGFFSLKMIEYGAKEVVGIDADISRIKKANFVAGVYRDKNLNFEIVNIFEKDFKKLGHFDFALCMGFLHRIPEIYTAIKILTEMSDMILFEWKCLKQENYAQPVLVYRGARSKVGNKYSALYWIPSIPFVVEILKDLGFIYNFVIEDISRWKRSVVISSRFDHSIFEGKKFVSNRSKFSFLAKYSRSYIANIFRLLIGKLEL